MTTGRLTTAQAAAVAGVKPSTIRGWVSRGHLTRHTDGVDLAELKARLDTRDVVKARAGALSSHAQYQERHFGECATLENGNSGAGADLRGGDVEDRAREAKLMLAAKAVMDAITGQGAPEDIINYLCDDDDNPGQKLLAAIEESHAAVGYLFR